MVRMRILEIPSNCSNSDSFNVAICGGQGNRDFPDLLCPTQFMELEGRGFAQDPASTLDCGGDLWSAAA
jgi:hypothetical protein